MRIEINRSNLLIVPESDQDRAFIEDTLNLKNNNESISIERIEDVTLGFNKKDSYVLKSKKV